MIIACVCVLCVVYLRILILPDFLRTMNGMCCQYSSIRIRTRSLFSTCDHPMLTTTYPPTTPANAHIVDSAVVVNDVMISCLFVNTHVHTCAQARFALFCRIMCAHTNPSLTFVRVCVSTICDNCAYVPIRFCIV